MKNDVALAILRETADRLATLGLHCTLSPVSLPQGLSVSLIVSDTQYVTAATHVAIGWGAASAHASQTSMAFTLDVDEWITNGASGADALASVSGAELEQTPGNPK